MTACGVPALQSGVISTKPWMSVFWYEWRTCGNDQRCMTNKNEQRQHKTSACHGVVRIRTCGLSFHPLVTHFLREMKTVTKHILGKAWGSSSPHNHGSTALQQYTNSMHYHGRFGNSSSCMLKREDLLHPRALVRNFCHGCGLKYALAKLGAASGLLATKGTHVRYLTLVTDAKHVSSPLRSLHLTPDVITHMH